MASSPGLSCMVTGVLRTVKCYDHLKTIARAATYAQTAHPTNVTRTSKYGIIPIVKGTGEKLAGIGHGDGHDVRHADTRPARQVHHHYSQHRQQPLQQRIVGQVDNLTAAEDNGDPARRANFPENTGNRTARGR